MSALYTILERYSTVSSAVMQTCTFEQLFLQFLQTDVVYLSQFSAIYTYREWNVAQKYKISRKHHSIDLVAKNRHDDKFTAIQCQFYPAKSQIKKSDIASFVSTSNTSDFSARLLIDTSCGLATNALNLLQQQTISCAHLTIADLLQSTVDWQHFLLHNTWINSPKKTLYNYQQDAVATVLTGFSQANRGMLLMAAGTGKSLVSLRIAEELTAKQPIAQILVLAPRLSLINQLMREYTQQASRSVHAIVVCSDMQFSQQDSLGESDVSSLICAATTDAAALSAKLTYCRQHLSITTNISHPQLTIVFATYHSLAVVHAAQAMLNSVTDTAALACFDMMICDEAHYTISTLINTQTTSALLGVHDNSYIVANKRLYMTASPRVYTTAAKNQGANSGVDMQSMNQQHIYGEIFYNLNFSEAIRQDILNDYKIVIKIVNRLNSQELSYVQANLPCLNLNKTLSSLNDIKLIKRYRAQVVAAVHEFIRHNARCLADGVAVSALDPILLSVEMHETDSTELVLSDSVAAYRAIYETINAFRLYDERVDHVINIANITQGAKPNADITSYLRRHIELVIDIDNITLSLPITNAIYTKIAAQARNRRYWQMWATDIGSIIAEYASIIQYNLDNNRLAATACKDFVNDLQQQLNTELTTAEVIEMFTQHLIATPVFNALFPEYDFIQHNRVSQAIQRVLNQVVSILPVNTSLNLKAFYIDMQESAALIGKSATRTEIVAAKQVLMIEIYDKIFTKVFPLSTAKLGIVHSAPVECIDFIIHSVNEVLKNTFHSSLATKDVHIINPFTATGTFITRFLQSGLLNKRQLAAKYLVQTTEDGQQHCEIHANTLGLLTYYIAAINIESTYNVIIGSKYQQFGGLCLTDPFALTDDAESIITNSYSADLSDNYQYCDNQNKLAIKVIIGNLPHCVVQKNEYHDSKNTNYAVLDDSITSSYQQHSQANCKQPLRDVYIRAICWASDQISKNGVIGFITNSSWLESSSADGVRYCLAQEFSSIYIINLRGNLNKNSMNRENAAEGDNIFGSQSKSGIAITLFIKDQQANTRGKIYYYDIGDNLTCTQKLTILADFKSIAYLNEHHLWRQLTADKHNDWLHHRDDSFDSFIPLLQHQQQNNVLVKAIFADDSLSAVSMRNAYIYNFSKGLFAHNKQNIAVGLRCPFGKMWCNNHLINKVKNLPKFFPSANHINKVICISRMQATFSVIMTDVIANFDKFGKMQYLPLYLYDAIEATDIVPIPNALQHIYSNNGELYQLSDGITDAAIAHFRVFYQDSFISKESLFYYIYGILHSPHYRSRYADTLTKEFARIPTVATLAAFHTFEQAGRTLSNLHLNYEHAKLYPVQFNVVLTELSTTDLLVAKMQFGTLSASAPQPLDQHQHCNTELEDSAISESCTTDNNNYTNNKKATTASKDKSVIVYNSCISISNIPLQAYEYTINGKSAIEWIMDRYAMRKYKGISNDPNVWSNNPYFIIELLQRVITVSLNTLKIAAALPAL